MSDFVKMYLNGEEITVAKLDIAFFTKLGYSLEKAVAVKQVK